MKRHCYLSSEEDVSGPNAQICDERATAMYKADSDCQLCRRQPRFTKLPTDSKANMPLMASLHGNLGFVRNRPKQRPMTWELQRDPHLRRDAPQKPTQISFKLVFESSQTGRLLCPSLRMKGHLLPSH